MSEISYQPKQIFEKFFKKHSTKPDYYVCRCGNERKIIEGNGYSNASSHVLKDHADYKIIMASSVDDQQTTLNFHNTGISDLAKQEYQWLEFIIMTNQSFISVENRYVQAIAKFKPISRSRLMKLIDSVSKLIKIKLSLLIPEKQI